MGLNGSTYILCYCTVYIVREGYGNQSMNYFVKQTKTDICPSLFLRSSINGLVTDGNTVILSRICFSAISSATACKIDSKHIRECTNLFPVCRVLFDFCLICFFTSHQQSFSYKGTGLPGLNQY